MIWFGNLAKVLVPQPHVPAAGDGDEAARMEHALRAVACHSPHLAGDALAEALAETGWVDAATARRLLPVYRHFDPDRYFAESLRALSIRGPAAAEEFRARIQRVLQDLTGEARVSTVGPEEAVRFRHGGREGIVLAYPEVSFAVGGPAAEAVRAATEEMPDALVVVAKNFREGTREQLASMLHRTEVPGTLVTVNLLLGMRAVALRLQPGTERIVDLLGAGRPLHSRDLGLLGNRA